MLPRLLSFGLLRSRPLRGGPVPLALELRALAFSLLVLLPLLSASVSPHGTPAGEGVLGSEAAVGREGIQSDSASATSIDVRLNDPPESSPGAAESRKPGPETETAAESSSGNGPGACQVALGGGEGIRGGVGEGGTAEPQQEGSAVTTAGNTAVDEGAWEDGRGAVGEGGRLAGPSSPSGNAAAAANGEEATAKDGSGEADGRQVRRDGAGLLSFPVAEGEGEGGRGRRDEKPGLPASEEEGQVSEGQGLPKLAAEPSGGHATLWGVAGSNEEGEVEGGCRGNGLEGGHLAGCERGSTAGEDEEEPLASGGGCMSPALTDDWGGVLGFMLYRVQGTEQAEDRTQQSLSGPFILDAAGLPICPVGVYQRDSGSAPCLQTGSVEGSGTSGGGVEEKGSEPSAAPGLGGAAGSGSEPGPASGSAICAEQALGTPSSEIQPEARPSRARPPGLDEYKKTLTEQALANETARGPSPPAAPPMRRKSADGSRYNYAAAVHGAKVVAANQEARGAGAVLDEDKDKYLRNPCSAEGKFLVIQLSEALTRVDTVVLSNYEFYSSTVRGFRVYGSRHFPCEEWFLLGEFAAQNVRTPQSFEIGEAQAGALTRFVKMEFLDHHGSEFFCTLSLVRVHGVDELESLKEEMEAMRQEVEEAESALRPKPPLSSAPPSTSATPLSPPPRRSELPLGVGVGVPGGAVGLHDGAGTDQLGTGMEGGGDSGTGFRVPGGTSVPPNGKSNGEVSVDRNGNGRVGADGGGAVSQGEERQGAVGGEWTNQGALSGAALASPDRVLSLGDGAVNGESKILDPGSEVPRAGSEAGPASGMTPPGTRPGSSPGTESGPANGRGSEAPLKDSQEASAEAGTTARWHQAGASGGSQTSVEAPAGTLTGSTAGSAAAGPHPAPPASAPTNPHPPPPSLGPSQAANQNQYSAPQGAPSSGHIPGGAAVPAGRSTGDFILKTLMLKIRGLELNQSLLDRYVDDTLRTQQETLTDMDAELASLHERARNLSLAVADVAVRLSDLEEQRSRQLASLREEVAANREAGGAQLALIRAQMEAMERRNAALVSVFVLLLVLAALLYSLSFCIHRIHHWRASKARVPVKELNHVSQYHEVDGIHHALPRVPTLREERADGTSCRGLCTPLVLLIAAGAIGVASLV